MAVSITSITDCAKQNDGRKIPWLGLGTYQSPSGQATHDAVLWALEAGYRHIDTAALYKNESDVGTAVRESGIPREQIYITTKVWNSDIRGGTVAQAMDASLKKLGMDYVDLYLLHWPVAGKFVAAWKAMENLQKQGKARSIGVSNFLVNHLEELLPTTKVVPAVNQVEWHPYIQQPTLVNFCQKKGIVFEAWAPLMQGRVGEVDALFQIGHKYGKTPAQTAIRWGMQHGIVMIPKSVHKARIVENAGVFDFQLTDEEMKRIDAVDRNVRVGPDPANFNF
jgi:methylglyoxal/glyoxal reductase